MRSSHRKKAIEILLAAVVLASMGCGGANQENSKGQIVSPKLPGSSVSSSTTGATTGGQEGGGLATGGDENGGENDKAPSEQDPALIMHIINSALN